jgi:hypothetical protein
MTVRPWWLAIGLVAAAGALAACGSSGSDKAGGRGAAGHTQTLRLHTSANGQGGYFPIETKHKAPSGLSAGFAKTSSIDDQSGVRAGFQDQLCIAGGIEGRADCTLTLSLKRGTIVATGVFTDGGGLGGTLAVTGGTGAYEGARGTYTVSVPGPNGQLVLIHLLLP